jgi:rhomboid family GlyGly-CTERM serine protease
MRAPTRALGIIRARSSRFVRTVTVSTAERYALLLAAAVLLLQLAAPETLEYQRARLVSEPWRLLSAHLVHVNWTHAAINAAALVIVARLFADDLSATSQLATLAAAAVVISVSLALLWPSIVWYRGLSGALHALYFAGATAALLRAPLRASVIWLPLLLVVGGWIKVVLEQPAGDATPYAEWLGAQVVPQAHLAGAVCGTTMGLAIAALQAHRRQRKQQQ